MSELDFRNTNSLWCSVLVETLVRCGVRQAVCSPGSRSTALTMALARHAGIEAVPVLDERSAAFFALGLAKQTRRAVVLVCTSGTAGANYFPAIIEAKESGVPLIVITADRPPEMRECASGQTIDQQKIFGSFVTWYHELAVPEPTVAMLRYLRQTIAYACVRAMSGGSGLGERGPVHLNAPFRDPLPPIENGTAKGIEGQIDEAFFAHLSSEKIAITSSAVQRPMTARGLIVAGAYAAEHADKYAEKLSGLARTLGWPVLVDVLSPARHLAMPGVTRVSAYDAILRNEKAARELTPRTVLCLGSWPTSKVLRGWLEQTQAETLLVAPTTNNRDALHGKTRQLVLPVENLTAVSGGAADASYVQAWMEAETAARGVIDATLEKTAERFEAKAAWLMARSLPAGTPVFVANSMPVRDLEYVWPVTERGTQIYFSRGANGIDGTLSTALGIAHRNEKPAVLLTGDLALLHDANGFLIKPKLRGSLTIVLINNDGGGIFGHLPVAQFEPPFEGFFATPQQVDFATLCAAHGVEHVAVKDWAEFETLIAALPASGVRVLEVRTDRKRDAAARKELFARAAEAVGSTLA
ncbi:2-succinyl-5-enolpyruvyl-6-hydroxy-3-cyclohexene-1-carboxylic-acid synthase [Nibricoccus aquaticus]|uniref:2-succinyl-5-enolpyruvyl-6-hydroxy-3-cyclohexene-1-carboxylate synthase n=1 Tax=Nibricoccus aquaticus TaxID=2576891 RepID=A0A290QM84_9BACT|nr:2-succinyl-5-enolpyruvyl-6-hydroxy-3-cyclohexene-1-carboxylic-acid synthase [Nibricoccus aquaticus]ATC65691.1 2-succinyl-5-enolpyruvyl-6-hydroxy-3-cyclohexene-1-carboxylic-acid synthase [Nibricoccus aquaticus]